ncbi:CoxG family protein [Dictyobacter aurantiacus]|uniref:Carbon monoxide dehydrogenase n=1 Tax=Dictyobacter aurantiacus TaxID=1936993 RepID=A0A401Z7P1_9CHLR|nr:SRPBCC domain-containing protein [Dictyobacter aurantiacus]GCE02855.1 carbon monoxide dehydrogenase [Dictyobacter aurantiacus]
MKLSGTHKFKASSVQVFNAILNPEVLKASIPGANSVSYENPNTLYVEITTSLPGLRGPYGLNLNIVRRQDPSYLELQLLRQGKGGSINAVAQISLVDEADGALLTYNGNAELEGPVAIASNPLGQGIVKNSLSSFFKNLEKNIA